MSLDGDVYHWQGILKSIHDENFIKTCKRINQIHEGILIKWSIWKYVNTYVGGCDNK